MALFIYLIILFYKLTKKVIISCEALLHRSKNKMKPSRELEQVSREERVRRFIAQLEDDKKHLKGRTYPSLVSSLFQGDLGAFPFNTRNYVWKETLEEVADSNSIPRAIATRLFNVLEYLGEKYAQGSPTEEVAIHLYHQSLRNGVRHTRHRDFGIKSFELLEKYLQHQGLLK